jgi:hypothetical protein
VRIVDCVFDRRYWLLCLILRALVLRRLRHELPAWNRTLMSARSAKSRAIGLLRAWGSGVAAEKEEALVSEAVDYDELHHHRNFHAFLEARAAVVVPDPDLCRGIIRRHRTSIGSGWRN